MTSIITKEKKSNNKIVGILKVSFNGNSRFHLYTHDGKLNEYRESNCLPLNFKMSAGTTEEEVENEYKNLIK